MRGGIPARNIAGERLLIFVGIIDILQSYRLVKKMEHTFKAIIHDGVGAAIDYIDFSFIIHRTLFPYTSQPSMQTVSRSLCQTRFSGKLLKVRILDILDPRGQLNENCNSPLVRL